MSETETRPTIEQDVPCAGCGYDLRGLSPEGNCPECGFGIAKSVVNVATRWRSRSRE